MCMSIRIDYIWLYKICVSLFLFIFIYLLEMPIGIHTVVCVLE